jgi:putative ABC transport system permease protein
MFRNYFIVTLRNLRKNGFYSVINIAGLSIGIACTILILLWVIDEMSFDKMHSRADRIYQVWVQAKFDGKVSSWTSVPLPTYEAMKAADSNIKRALVMDWGGNHLLTSGEDRRIIKRGYWASEEFFEVFDFELVSGNKAQVLDDPPSIVISQSLSKALFGDEDPLGKTIRLDNENDVKVTGVMKDVPTNSSFQFDYIVPWKFRETISEWIRENTTNWGNYSFQVFVELNEPANAHGVESRIKKMLQEHGETDTKPEFFLYPMLRWRLHSSFDEDTGLESGGMTDYVQLFTIIAIFIIVIACINFMNLATARSERRAREVGIRKSVGSRRRELIAQFIGESTFIALIAFAIAVLFTQLVLPYYNQMVEKKLFIDYASSQFWLLAVAVIIITGLVSGSYPAFYLSSFQPVKVLKGKPSIGRGGSTPRKVLVTLQFCFSILLIIGTIVVYQQIQLVKGRSLGYDQENLMTTEYTNEVEKNYKVIKQELLTSGVVESVTRSNSAITDINSNNFLGWPGKPEELRVIFTTIVSEYDYTRTMGIKVLEGRDFSEDFKSDSSAIIVNKAALEVMGLKDPIGTELDLWGKKRKLVGITENVLMGSPYEPVKPMFVVLDDWGGAVSIRLSKTNDLQASINKVKSIFEKYSPAYPFEYKFADVEFQKKFTTINLTSQLASTFATLAIIITGLGLFGLAAFTAEQRTKELGIRKVLGASVFSLVKMISKDFSVLVIASFIIASPIAWWLLTQYLEKHYTIRTPIEWWVFVVTGIIALVFAVVIVSTQALRAAMANPVNSLRAE